MATYPVVTVQAGPAIGGEVPRGGGLQQLVAGRVNSDELADQLRNIIASLGAVVHDGEAFRLPLPLKSMEVGLTITAEGKVGFLGSGATLTGEGSIVLTFENPGP